MEKHVVLHKFDKHLTKHKFDKNIMQCIIKLFAFSDYKNNVLYGIYIFFLCEAWIISYNEIS